MQSRLTEREWQEIEEFRRDWPGFCDADPVAHDFAERMEAAGFIELTAATGREMEEDMFWVEKYGPEPPSQVWTLTTAGRAALAREGK